jgi:hypothetical protein
VLWQPGKLKAAASGKIKDKAIFLTAVCGYFKFAAKVRFFLPEILYSSF